jgi:RNA polymerase sigma-70 factor (ECF subfamily)
VVNPGRGTSGDDRSSSSTSELRAIYVDQLPYVLSTLRRLGVGERDLEDITHDVFVTVHRRLPDYDRGRPVRPWLFGIAYRAASDYRRLARHRREDMDHEVDAPDMSQPVDERMDQAQKRSLLVAALQDVELERRAVLLMHDLDGIGVPEIAEQLGIPLNTAYSRLRLARSIRSAKPVPDEVGDSG